MLFMSKKKFEREVEKRLCDRLKVAEENLWRNEREREQHRYVSDLEQRLIVVEKRLRIKHPSHQRGETARGCY